MTADSYHGFSPLLIHSLRGFLLIDFALEEGINVNEILVGTNFSEEQFRSRETVINKVIYGQIVKNLIEIVGHCDFALRYGSRLNVSSRGSAGLVLMSMPNLLDAFKMLGQFQDLLDVPHKGSSKKANEDFNLILKRSSHPFYTDEFWRFNIETNFSSFFVTINTLLQGKLELSSVHFTLPRPDYAAAAEDIFQCEVHYASESDKMIFPERMLSIPFPTANKFVAEQSENYFKKVLSERRKTEPLTIQVNSILHENMGKYPDLTQVARQLNLSERSFRRKLSAEGVSYKELLDTTRKLHSTKLLRENSCSVEAVAKSIGFSEASNFRRAFKGWYGMTPAEFREKEMISSSGLQQQKS